MGAHPLSRYSEAKHYYFGFIVRTPVQPDDKNLFHFPLATVFSWLTGNSYGHYAKETFKLNVIPMFHWRKFHFTKRSFGVFLPLEIIQPKSRATPKILHCQIIAKTVWLMFPHIRLTLRKVTCNEYLKISPLIPVKIELFLLKCLFLAVKIVNFMCFISRGLE